jgi:hypothetical protein
VIIAALWAAQIALFTAALLLDWRKATADGSERRIATPVRLGISASLVVAAWLIDALYDSQPYSQRIARGMLCGFIGDLIMARVIPLPNRLIGGMVAFGIGHGFYVSGFLATLRAHALPAANWGLWAGVVLYGCVTLGGWQRGIRNPSKPAAVNIGALLYGGWIGVMATCAASLATGLGGAWWFASLGGFLFVASDLLIGLTEIGEHRIAHAQDWIWATYLAGQMGIVYAGWLVGG